MNPRAKFLDYCAAYPNVSYLTVVVSLFGRMGLHTHIPHTYDHAKKRKPTGCNESDVLSEAHHIHESDTGKRFGLEHAWHMLKNDPKWLSMLGMDSSSKRSKINVQGNYSSSSDPDTPHTLCTPNTPTFMNNMDEPVNDNEREDTPLRPIGVKAAKRIAKEKT